MQRTFPRVLAVASLALALSACADTQPKAPTAITNSTEGYQHAVDVMHQSAPAAYTGNADVDFAAAMIPHHQGAIDMANVELKYGKSPKLHSFSKTLVKDQSAEIVYMQTWLQTVGYPAKFPAATADNAEITANKAVVEAMHKGMSAAYTSNADVDFATMMIPHHQAAIDMAKVETKNGKDAKLRKLAASIVTKQTKEIGTLKSWLKWHADYEAGKSKHSASKPAAKKTAVAPAKAPATAAKSK